jgi:hypothetical protein
MRGRHRLARRLAANSGNGANALRKMQPKPVRSSVHPAANSRGRSAGVMVQMQPTPHAEGENGKQQLRYHQRAADHCAGKENGYEHGPFSPFLKANQCRWRNYRECTDLGANEKRRGRL